MEKKEPITHLLSEAGFDKMDKDSTMDQVEQALELLASNLKGKSSLRLQATREEAIQRLRKIGVSSPSRLVDTALEAAQVNDSDPPQDGLILSEPEPWEAPVDGAALLENVSATFKRFLVLPDGAAETLALWVLHTHCFEAVYYTPYLNINSPEKGCGKTTCLEILGHLVTKPVFSSNITAPAVFRTVERYHPTLLIDEADTFLSLKEELRGVLNSGNRKNTAYAIRLVGEKYDPKTFSTWCPKALALIGRLPDTLEDRSIVVTMHRKTKEEKVQEFHPNRMASELKTVQRKCARWAKDHLDALKVADPQIPEELHNRTRDKWRPLLSITEVVGGEWPERAREASLRLSAYSTSGTDRSLGVQLLADIRELFDREQIDRLGSAVIEQELGNLEDGPWSEYRGTWPITKTQIARLLAPFEIKPKQLWMGKKTRGYERIDFEDAFSRYLPSSQTVGTVEPSDGKGLSLGSNSVGDSNSTVSEKS